MRQTRLDTNADPGGRKNLRPALAVAVGLIALGIAAAAVLDRPVGRSSAGSTPADSNAVNIASAPTESGFTNASASGTFDAAKPHFERSEEPAVEDSVNAHGG